MLSMRDYLHISLMPLRHKQAFRLITHQPWWWVLLSGQLVMGDSKHCDNTPMSPVSMCPCLAITDDLWWTLNMSSPGSRLATAWVTLYSYESQKSAQTKTAQWKNVLIWDMTQYKTHLCWILIRPNIDNVDMFLWLRQIFKMNRRRLITKMYDW